MEIPRHTARGIVIHDQRILLMERWRPGHHYFSIPGGGIEPGETPQQTVVREFMEETACEVRTERLVYLLETAEGNCHHIFLCRYLRGEPRLAADSPEAIRADPDNRFKPDWLPLSDLPEAPAIIWKPVLRRLVEDLQNGFAPDVVSLRTE